MKSRIFRTTWQNDAVRLGELRRKVFVIEQNVPEALEWDDHDAVAVHFACEDMAQRVIIGTARVVADGAGNKAIIGRLCVASEFRHHGVATSLMRRMLGYCRDTNFTIIELHAQLYLRVFYEGFGFIAEGATYLEAGIEHITMVSKLVPDEYNKT